MKNYRDTETGQFVKSPATRSVELTQELYRAFDYFNKRFADGELPKVVITIQEAGRKNALGWFGNGFWKDDVASVSVPEINISAEHLDRNAFGTLETLLHEMAHLKNAVNDIRDCTSGQYHNKHFKKTAEEFGLVVKRTHNKGYAFTKLGHEAEKAIQELKPKKEIFKGLRRKRIHTTREKKYISLIINSKHEELLADAVERSGLSQKEFVEAAVVATCNVVINCTHARTPEIRIKAGVSAEIEQLINEQ